MRDNATLGVYRKKIEKSKKEEQEFGPGKKEFTVCSSCNAVYYEKNWHHGFVPLRGISRSETDYKHLTENKAVNFTLCPACQMIKDDKYEGKVIFENAPETTKSDILANIKNTGERAYDRNPMARVITAKSVKRKAQNSYDIEVLTTENQLARNIARQVEKAFRGCTSEVIWSKEESAAVIKVKFT